MCMRGLCLCLCVCLSVCVVARPFALCSRRCCSFVLKMDHFSCLELFVGLPSWHDSLPPALPGLVANSLSGPPILGLATPAEAFAGVNLLFGQDFLCVCSCLCMCQCLCLCLCLCRCLC